MKILRGRVVSNKMEKTAVVTVDRFYHHPVYKKRVKKTKKYKADDRIGVKVGDIVEIQEVRPLSKEKRWKIIKVIKSQT